MGCTGDSSEKLEDMGGGERDTMVLERLTQSGYLYASGSNGTISFRLPNRIIYFLINEMVNDALHCY